MIINLHLENVDTHFQELPAHYLPNHEVCLLYMYVKLRKPTSHGLVTVASSLVDKSAINLQQELTSFYNYSYYDTASDRIVYQPTHPKWYKLQCEHIGDSFIEIITEKPLEPENNSNDKKIEKIYLQLAFQKICRDSTRQ